MPNKPRLARVARTRGEFALLVFRRVAADGTIKRAELPVLEAALIDAVTEARRVDSADALARAIGRATDGRHVAELARMYQEACDGDDGEIAA